MLEARRLPIVRDAFLIGYSTQREWNWLIAAAFFFGKVGAGLFFLSYLTDFTLGALVGLLVVGVGKSGAHLLFLGRPERCLGALRRWRTSWISQGMIAMGVFVVFGAVYLALDGVVGKAFGAVALAGALFLMIYDGFLLKSSRGIALWNSSLLPVLALFYSLLAGTTLALVLRAATGSEATEAQLEWMQIALVALNLVLVALYVLTAQIRSAAAELAVHLLTRGRLGLAFLVGAVGVGLVGTIALAVVVVLTGSTAALALAAATDLFGHFVVFFAILRAGTYAPLRGAPTPAPVLRFPVSGHPSP